MIHRRWFVFGALLAVAARSWADMPYPPNPQPCSGTTVPPTCIAATAFSQYLFLPTTTPLTLPNDFGNDNWKLTSDHTGEASIDSNPQELFGVKGARVDRAWQVTTGRPDVLIAVLDSGIRWADQLPDLVNKLHINRGELPVPEGSTNLVDPWDRNADGVFNIQDYAGDSRVSDQNGNGMIDPEDLIFIFSDGTDDDHNGFVDDIAGWDFFEDDNDPLDEVRYGHGTGEAEDSNAEANNGIGDVGTCPSCMVMPVRVGDSFVAEVNNFAQAVLFATDSGARVIQEALGALNNSSLAQAAIDYAYHRGVIVVASAADEESNHHNYPANYNHTLEVNSVTRFNDVNGAQQTPHSYLYLNGCTNFGGHIAVAVPSSSCSSEATGKSAGMAGLLYSAALNEIDRGHLTPYPKGDGTFEAFPLSANEVKQLLTTTADDINFDARPELQTPLPQNYTSASPFPGVQMSERFHSIAGWDQYFGYGRVNADVAVRRVGAGKIPPEASIESSPDWFAVIYPGDLPFRVSGVVAANRAASFAYTFEMAPGIQPAESDFAHVAGEQDLHFGRAVTAQIPMNELIARMPHGVDGPAIDEHGQPDPDRFTFTVRLRVVDDSGNVGEDRRVYFLHRDPDLLGSEAAKFTSDGAASPLTADLDGDGIEELIVANSDGEVHAYRGDNSELPGWPVHTDLLELHTDAPAFHSAEISAASYAAIPGGPAVGDLHHDGHLDVVAADMQGKVYVWNSDGVLQPGFPVSTLAAYSNTHRSERDLSTSDGRVPDLKNHHNSDNRLARGIAAGPTLGNLDGSADGSLEIVIGALDRHVYAWHADGTPVPGWPALLKDPTKVDSVDPLTNEVTLKAEVRRSIGTKIVTPVSLGDLDGDGKLDVVVGVNEEYGERPNARFRNQLIALYQAAGALDSGNGRTYALFHDGTRHGSAPIDHGWNPDAFMPGWPVKIAVLTQGLLPTVGTGVDGSPALADLNKDGRAEVAVFSFLGPVYIFNGLGQSFLGNVAGVPKTLEADTFGSSSNSIDAPAYPALGGGAVAEMAGPGGGFQFIAPVSGFGKLVDANLAAHQTPSENQLAVWDIAKADGTPASGNFRTAFPRVVNDLQILTAPAVADIDGDGLPEAIEGSGVYDLHAFNINGVEPAGWPKLTGGWTATTATVGDIDGDGKLQVASLTREGSLFVWRTTADECSPTPWRKRNHDEWNTSNYDTDARPPAPVLPQTVTLSGSSNGILELALAAVPGDDLYCGAPATFDVRYATQPITSEAAFAAAGRAQIVSSPQQSGRHQQGTLRAMGLEQFPYGPAYVAVRTTDAAGNRSPIMLIGQALLGVEATPTATASSTITPTPTATLTPLPTSTNTATVTASATLAPTMTRTPSPSATATTAVATPDDGGCAIDPPAPTAWWLMMLPIALLGWRQASASWASKGFR